MEKPYRLTEEERTKIMGLAAQHLMLKDIAAKVGRNVATVRLALKKAGVEPYWKKGSPRVVHRVPRITSKYGGFVSTRTGAHYYITKGYQGRFFIAYSGTAYSGMMTDSGYKTPKEARVGLAYLKSLFESEGVTCIDDISNG